ncbi:hypothetical protein HK096_000813, partial [Nowakowskiella sp. JEL0078]
MSVICTIDIPQPKHIKSADSIFLMINGAVAYFGTPTKFDDYFEHFENLSEFLTPFEFLSELILNSENLYKIPIVEEREGKVSISDLSEQTCGKYFQNLKKEDEIEITQPIKKRGILKNASTVQENFQENHEIILVRQKNTDLYLNDSETNINSEEKNDEKKTEKQQIKRKFRVENQNSKYKIEHPMQIWSNQDETNINTGKSSILIPNYNTVLVSEHQPTTDENFEDLEVDENFLHQFDSDEDEDGIDLESQRISESIKIKSNAKKTLKDLKLPPIDTNFQGIFVSNVNEFPKRAKSARVVESPKFREEEDLKVIRNNLDPKLGSVSDMHSISNEASQPQ